MARLSWIARSAWYRVLQEERADIWCNLFHSRSVHASRPAAPSPGSSDGRRCVVPLNQIRHSVLAVLDRLRCLAPAAVEDRIGGRDARGRRCVIAAHDADEHTDALSWRGCAPASGSRSGSARWTSSFAQAREPARSRRYIPSPRSRQHLPQHDCNEARERERYQIGGHLSPRKNCAADRVMRRDRFGREPYPRLRGPQRREQAQRRGPARSRVHGQQWFGRRRA